MKTLLLATAPLLIAPPAFAQDHAGHTMPGMEMPAPAPTPLPTPTSAPQDHAMDDMPGMDEPDFSPPFRKIPSSAGSGTSRLPRADGMMNGGFHAMSGDWMFMAMGSALLAYTDQGGPRGDDQLYSGSMAMLQAKRSWSGGTRLALTGMWSLDPVNGQRGYPNLFASGETAHGQPLIDRQHPHDLFMELSARIDVPLAHGLTGFVYAAPVGEPALGPAAFVHRRSARYLPLSPIGHHWFDSTHVTYGVVTAGIATPHLQLEGSAFRGREPDEHRWDLETPKLDSWSLRATWSPSPEWTVQASHARLEQPEAMHPGEDERRTTASIHYGRDGISAMLAFSAKNRVPGDTLTAWLAEANWDLSKHHSLFGRIENVANDEIFPDHADPLHDRTFRVTRFEGGYAYRIPLGEAELALGGSLAAYAKPRALDAAYGSAPLSYTVFTRLGFGL